jgi:hypothetical protein
MKYIIILLFALTIVSCKKKCYECTQGSTQFDVCKGDDNYEQVNRCHSQPLSSDCPELWMSFAKKNNNLNQKP